MIQLLRLRCAIKTKVSIRYVGLFNIANNENFKNLIGNESWVEITEEMDAQTVYNNFTLNNKHYNTAYPLKSQRKRRKNERVNSKP